MVSWEGYSSFIPGFGDEASQTQMVFWVCEGQRIHTGWKTTLARDNQRTVDTAIYAGPLVAGDPPKPNCGCSGRPPEEWRRVLLIQVSGERPPLPI